MNKYDIEFEYDVVVRYKATTSIEAENASIAAEKVAKDFVNSNSELSYHCTEDGSVELRNYKIISMDIKCNGETDKDMYVGKNITVEDIIEYASKPGMFNLTVTDNKEYDYMIERYSNEADYIWVSSYFILNEFEDDEESVNIQNEDVRDIENHLPTDDLVVKYIEPHNLED